MSTIAERVAAGAAFLDQHDPGWWQFGIADAIDLDTLNLEDTGLCVLGQRCPLETLRTYLHNYGDDDAAAQRYWAYAYELRRQTGVTGNVFTWAYGYGFADEPGGYTGLTAEWKRVIGERRAA